MQFTAGVSIIPTTTAAAICITGTLVKSSSDAGATAHEALLAWPRMLMTKLATFR